MTPKHECETCYFGKSFVVGKETHCDCTLDFLEELKCVLNGLSHYVPIKDAIIPLKSKEVEDDDA